MNMNRNVILLPLDARPVCLQLPLDVAAMTGISIHAPAKEALGVLKEAANLSEISAWLEKLLNQHPEAPVIASLDLIVYGGLIPSRIHHDSLEDLQTRLRAFLEHPLLKNRRIYSFSSIMRIPNYNNAEEEPDYWAEEGAAIYQASANAHASGDTHVAFQSVSEPAKTDFLTRRQINFELNQYILTFVDSGQIAQHIFAQDDTGEFGLNVQEAQQLKQLAESKNLPVSVQTGADEIALLMLCRSVLDTSPIIPKIAVEYWPQNSEKAMAKFDGLPVESVVQSKISACASQLVINQSDADITLLVNGPRQNRMGDHCENQDTGSLSPNEKTAWVQRATELLQAPLAIVDVAFANGGDNELMKALSDANFPLLDLYAYAAWNTPGNSIGTVVATALLTWVAKQNGTFNRDAHHKLILTRLLDDWGYQACVRKTLRASGVPATNAESNLNRAMHDIETKLAAYLNISKCKPKSYSLPCQRYFEIEIHF